MNSHVFPGACRQICRLALASLLICFASVSVASGVSVDTGGQPAKAYLPDNVSYDPAIPTPESVLGANVGEWHVRHDQLVSYMYTLADASDRITIEETGRTHENRPLLLLTITAPDNRSKLDSIREQHIAAYQKGAEVDSNAPLIFYMGYSIHGNEPSGANASMLVAYYLAAGQGEAIDALLGNNVVLLDPSFNPDGLSRFAQWANMHKGKQLVADPETREHEEGWPSGRTNHYWFDLNRDWLLLTHPESQARIKKFQQWRPHVLTDFHEMGTNSTYFFQPGVRSRKNPITPDGNVTLTEALAEYHAKALDDEGELYFSEEDFDDFYVGKGSTYPDVHGSIGILFEQASSRGHLQDSINGPLAFADTIQNQVTTSLSTFAGALANKPAILGYQRQFVKDTKALAEEDDIAGYLLARPDDHGRFNEMLNLLDQHSIDYDVVNKDTDVGGLNVTANNGIYIPVDQPQYRLVKSLFSTQQNFENNTFYDVSTWNLAMAFNLEYQAVSARKARSINTAANATLRKPDTGTVPADAYAYVIDWQDYYAPAMVQALLENDVTLRSAGKAFTGMLSSGKERDFAAGSIVIPTGLSQPDNLADILSEQSQALNIPVLALQTGMTSRGIDLGSRNMVPVTLPKVLLVGGEGTSEYEMGEIWHYLDTRVGLPATLVEQHRLERVTLGDYTHIIMSSGDYSKLSEMVTDMMDSWVNEGGVLIGQKSALELFADKQWLDIDIVSDDTIDEAFDTSAMRYGDRDDLYARKLVAGSVYNASIDTSHPLFYGYQGDTLPMFKTSNMVVESDNSPFTTVARYTPSPLMAGYSASEMQKLIGDTTAVIAERQKRGVVIGFVDNTQFRGYWYGTSKLMANAIYQSALLK
ncbi:M14 metallopeptidase family protein [Alteromonas halophila]|uniref:Peptidase M14 n=1 Tax=Alteromonas halophila TaxID=516698 RepID=A0A918MZX8_9ALTE|nr:M14 metallopeptidase family protein [Alteromonas halophila]GGW90949.1 peptidase M14 [Alteromonas halophila]